MLTQFGGYPAFEVMYDTGGHLVDPTAEQDALAYFGTGGGKAITDVVVISHGWNNDIPEARSLYSSFFASLRANNATPAGRSIGIVALFWPSKRFADAANIPGGAAGLTSLADTILSAQLNLLAELFAADPSAAGKIAHARSLLPVLEHSQSAQDDYVAALVSLVPKPRYDRDEGLDDARSGLDTAAGHTVLQQLSAPVSPTAPPPLTPGMGGAASFGAHPAFGAALVPGMGGAAGFSLGGLISGIKAGAANLGDVLTYYTMKDRAGIVGRTGALATVQKLRAMRTPPPNVHLVGHSFGGRLVTALANGLSGTGNDVVQTMTLLEAAYSHNGMAQNWDGAGNDGAFRSVIAARKVARSILITHSVHDWPNGTAYPLASRLMNQVAAALGDRNDKYGAIGRNGAQHTPEAIDDTLHPVGTAYAPFPAGKWVRNVSGDGPPPPNAPTITAHGDVFKPEITWAFLKHL